MESFDVNDENQTTFDVNNVNSCKNNVNIVCKVCKLASDGAHKCIKCKCVVHYICGKGVGEEGFGQSVICKFCQAKGGKYILITFSTHKKQFLVVFLEISRNNHF